MHGTALVHSLALLMHLRDRSSIKEVVGKAAVVAGACESLAEFEQTQTADVGRSSWAASGQVQHHKTLQRKQIDVDAAWCVVNQELLAQSVGPLFAWADSSPQHGVNWLLSTLMSVSQEHVLDVHQSLTFLIETSSTVQELCSSRGLARDEWESLCGLVQGRRAKASFCHSAIKMHRQIPVALGKSTTEHKAKAFMHKLLVESMGVQHVCDLLLRLRGWCVDMGTEMAIAQIRGLQANDLLPEWARTAEEQSMQLQSESSMVAAPLPQSLAPDVCAGGRPAHLLPYCLLSTGLCHIVHNMTSEVDIG